MPETVMDAAIKDGEHALKRSLHDCQTARDEFRHVLRQLSKEASHTDWLLTQDDRLARVERYLLHALSALPCDKSSRLQALDKHLKVVKTLNGC